MTTVSEYDTSSSSFNEVQTSTQVEQRREGLEATPQVQAGVLDLIFGRWRSQILYAGVKLGIFEVLAGPAQRAGDVAAALGLDPSLTYRLLRALASLGLLEEDGAKAFSLTAAGSLLRQDHPQTLRGVTLLEEGPEHYALWKHLPAMVKDGQQNAFVREFGRMAFDHAIQDEGYKEVFNAAMSSYSQMQAAMVMEAFESYNFDQITDICDVGGGHGFTLCTILAKHPHLKGTVLELANVLEDETLLWAKRMNLDERCEYVAGDMFKAVPPANAYFMKFIIHDWNDEECVQILSNCFDAAPQGGRVFIAEHVVPNPDTPHFAKLFDIHMMCWGTGRERTVEEYRSLLAQAGWEYIQTWYSGAQMLGIVEAVKP